MFFVCFIKVGVFQHACGDFLFGERGDFATIDSLLQLILDLVGDFHLLGIATEYDAGILRSRIVALSIPSCGIVKGEEELNERFKEFGRWIRQLDIQDFDVSSSATAHLTIRRILHRVLVRAHESDLGVFDAARKLFLKVLDDVLFGTPVAAGAESKSRRDRSHTVQVYV